LIIWAETTIFVTQIMFMKKIFTLILLLASYLGFTQSTTVVISQAYGGGGGTTGTYLFDYVELHNISNTSQDISGFSLQYGSATGNFGSSASNIYTFPASTSIPAGGYLLIQLSTTGTGGVALPVTPDFITTNLSMSGTNGKVALVNSSTALGCGATATPCTLPGTAIVDLVAWGTANNAEGGASVNNGVAITSTQGAVRKNNGCTETNNNNLDFDVVTAPVPRNSSSPIVNCILPVSLLSFTATPSNGLVNLAWSTTDEKNVASFEIERSVNGREFISIGSTAAKNSTSNNYGRTDEKPVAGVSYYRLKMIDLDGSYKYSNIVSVKLRSNGLSVYPNPVKDQISLQHDLAGKNATVSVVDFAGKQAMRVNIQQGALQTNIDATKLAPGTYMIIFENDGTRSTKQFVKQ